MYDIERKADLRIYNSVFHRVADIPGGVTIKTSDLGGLVLREGSPIGPGAGDLYEVHKTAVVLNTVASNATEVLVAKGHHFKTGDYLGASGIAGKAIVTIDKITFPTKDIVTLEASLGVSVPAGTIAFRTAPGESEPAVKGIAITGSSYNVEAGHNIFIDAWVLAVVQRSTAPKVDEITKGTLKGVIYL